MLNKILNVGNINSIKTNKSKELYMIDLTVFVSGKELTLSVDIEENEVYINGSIGEINNLATEMINKTFSNIDKLNVEKLELFSKKANSSKLTFKSIGKEFVFDLNWTEIIDLNPIEIPYTNGKIMGNYFEKDLLILFCKQYELANNIAEKSLVMANIGMLIESIMVNRFLHFITTIQSLYSLDIECSNKN